MTRLQCLPKLSSLQRIIVDVKFLTIDSGCRGRSPERQAEICKYFFSRWDTKAKKTMLKLKTWTTLLGEKYTREIVLHWKPPTSFKAKTEQQISTHRRHQPVWLTLQGEHSLHTGGSQQGAGGWQRGGNHHGDKEKDRQTNDRSNRDSKMWILKMWLTEVSTLCELFKK